MTILMDKIEYFKISGKKLEIYTQNKCFTSENLPNPQKTYDKLYGYISDYYRSSSEPDARYHGDPLLKLGENEFTTNAWTVKNDL